MTNHSTVSILDTAISLRRALISKHARRARELTAEEISKQGLLPRSHDERLRSLDRWIARLLGGVAR